MKILCMGCERNTDAPNLTPPVPVNLPAVSMVIVQHPEQFACQHCGAVLTVGIANAQFSLVGAVVPKQAEKPVIIVPGRG